MEKIDIKKYAIFRNIKTGQVVGIETKYLFAIRKKTNNDIEEIKKYKVPCVYLNRETENGQDVFRFVNENIDEVSMGDLSDYTIINYSGKDFIEIFGK